MTTLKNILNKSGRYIGTVSSFITVEGLIRDLNNQNLKAKYEAELLRNKELESKITKLLEEKIASNDNQNKILEIVDRRSNSIDIVRNDVNKIQELNNKLSNSELSDEIKENLTNQINQNVDKLSVDIKNVNKELLDLIDFFDKIDPSSSSNQILNDFNITDIINNYQLITNSYKNFLTTITLEQKGALAHILVSITLLFFLGSLVTIFYSDFLIKKLNWETKYPKLAKIFQIRRKFQEYYFLLNSIFIFIGLITIIYINYLYLTLLY